MANAKLKQFKTENCVIETTLSDGVHWFQGTTAKQMGNETIPANVWTPYFRDALVMPRFKMDKINRTLAGSDGHVIPYTKAKAEMSAFETIVDGKRYMIRKWQVAKLKAGDIVRLTDKSIFMRVDSYRPNALKLSHLKDQDLFLITKVLPEEMLTRLFTESKL